jgi:membrane-associated phospholipid phosphatase
MTGRGFGVAVAIDAVLPQALRELFALITHLGDAGFALAAIALVYWFADPESSGRKRRSQKRGDQKRGNQKRSDPKSGDQKRSDRERGAFAVVAILGAFGLTLALKGLFALPRPPSTIHVGYAEGYGFPSGHAITATTLWGLLALVVERGTRRTRALVAATVVVLVAASRVVIGVHYVADVVAGVAVGFVYLAVLVRVTDWRPTRGFLVAGGLALVALVTNGLTAHSVATIAGVLGAGGMWAALDTPPRTRLSPPIAVGGLAAIGVVGFAGNRFVVSLPAVFALNLVVPMGILALPLVVERVRKRRSASPSRI